MQKPPIRPAVAGWHVLCDFDHTITAQDVTDGLLGHFADPAWERLEAAWQEGRINARTCTSAQVALMDATAAQIDAYVDSVEVDRSFAAFVAFCDSVGVGIEVVSDGLDYGVRRILNRHGVGHLPVTANRLEFQPGGRCAVRFGHPGADCRAGQGVCKCAVAGQLSPDTRRLLIGDGHSDCCLAGQVDLVFARDRLLAHCQQNAIPHLPISDFTQALAALRALLAADHPVTPYLERDLA